MSKPAYAYESLLPWMFSIIKEKEILQNNDEGAQPNKDDNIRLNNESIATSDDKNDSISDNNMNGPTNVMSAIQATLWKTVTEKIVEIKGDPEYKQSDEAIQQYMVELRSWQEFWHDTPFPGVFPTFIELSAGSSTSNHIGQAREFVASPEDRNALRVAILKHNGNNFIPRHGWDHKTGLPLFSIVVKGKDCFPAFAGPGQVHITAVRPHFASFRILYQRSGYDLIVIWFEAFDISMVRRLNTSAQIWEAFKEMWAFFKSWSNMYTSRKTANIFKYLNGNRGNGFKEIDTSHLSPPTEFVADYNNYRY